MSLEAELYKIFNLYHKIGSTNVNLFIHAIVISSLDDLSRLAMVRFSSGLAIF